MLFQFQHLVFPVQLDARQRQLLAQPKNCELPDKTPCSPPFNCLISCFSPWLSVVLKVVRTGTARKGAMDANPGLPRALRAWHFDARGRKRPPVNQEHCHLWVHVGRGPDCVSHAMDARVDSVN